jgi:Tol biopolymer transport system component
MEAGTGLVGRVRMRFAILTGAAALLGFAALIVSASDNGDAAFPGLNGKIAYSSGSAYVTSIWSANADGSAPTQLTVGSGDYGPSYSADGNRIAFGRENGVAVMNADGSGLTQLTSGSYSSSSDTKWEENYDDPHSTEVIPFVRIQTYTEAWQRTSSPAFSPDGSQLAVAESKGNYTGKSICAVEALNDSECISSYGSTEGSYFDYEEECAGCTSHIVTISAASGALTGDVTPPSTTNEDYGPTYAANGALAFSRWSGSSSAIYVVSSPGAAAVQVTAGPRDSAPNFSPDGSRIVFEHGNREVGVVGAGGGPVTLLSALPLPAGTTSSYVSSPAFSPDGSRIVFERGAFNSSTKIDSGLYAMGVDGSGLTKIVNEGYGPDWQPVTPPPAPTPARGKSKKGNIKLNKKHEAVIGTIVCGSSPCKLKVLSALLKINQPKASGKKHGQGKTSTISKAKTKKSSNKPYAVKISVPKKLAPGKTAKVKAIVNGKALAGLRRAGKGVLTVKIRVTEGLGKKVVTFKSTLKPPPAAKKHQKKKSKH